jgi:uncharacterized protein (DUF4415 family)
MMITEYGEPCTGKVIDKTVQIRLEADVLEWLQQAGPGHQTRANAILRHAMLQER